MKSQPISGPGAAPVTEGPRVLCLHPTSHCALDCAPCYLKRNAYGEERPLEFFADLVLQTQRANGLREVALSVNVDADGCTRNRDALRVISQAARKTGVRLSATTNYENVKAWGASAFAGCHLVSLSLDEYKFPTLELPGDFFEQVTQLQAEGCAVNLNTLLSRRLLDYLTLDRLRDWLDAVDQVYLLIAKHHPLDFSRTQLLDFFAGIAPIWEEPDHFFHLQVDNCIKPAVFPWNQLSPTCEWGTNLVNVLPDGGLSLCAMDPPLAHLKAPADLGDAVKEHYVDQHRHGRSKCPFVEFAGD